MSTELLQLIFTFIPQMGGAVLFFWMCQKSADKQRQAYQDQIAEMYRLAEKMIDSLNEVMSVMNPK